MIEISVTGLQKSFDLEKKILDGLTFQINSGERVGLLGKNGAGKTTLFRILTGEIDYDAGEVAIASGRRVGLISQIPVYPAGYTVEDVLQSAFERMRRMADEMERLPDGTIRMRTNHSGGIQGGISNGEDICIRVAVKPTPTIAQPLRTVTDRGENVTLEAHGRHDPSILLRVPVVVESMCAIVLMDAMLMRQAGMGMM